MRTRKSKMNIDIKVLPESNADPTLNALWTYLTGTPVGMFVGQLVGDHGSEYGKPAVIVDEQISPKGVPTYSWTKPAKVFNLFTGASKVVAPHIASLIVAALLIQQFMIPEGIVNESEEWLVDVIDNIKQYVVKHDSEAYFTLLD